MSIQDRFLDEARKQKRVNMIFIPKDETPEFKPFCEICKRYMIYIRNQGYECPVCGNEYKAKKEDTDKLQSIRDSNPRICSKKGIKKKRSADFPPNATIIEDKDVTGAF